MEEEIRYFKLNLEFQFNLAKTTPNAINYLVLEKNSINTIYSNITTLFINKLGIIS